ncbi:MAG: MFS transporter [Tetrasphaera sp.]|nr:MFS transporter [Tetrasphaera sp.]
MLRQYRDVVAISTIRTAILVGFLARLPLFGAGVVVTLHVVRSLERSYTEAGIAGAALVLAIAVAGPWRGRLLDRYGLRRVLVGWVLALWALGSLIGGLVYGGLARPISPFLLLAALGAVTMLPALSTGTLSLGLLLLVAGLLGQPTITAALEQLVDRVPEVARGEAMGWHSTAMTSGLALGAPLSGAAIDRWGGAGGFVLVGLLGFVAGLSLWGLSRLRPGPRPATSGGR